eukprot:403331879
MNTKVLTQVFNEIDLARSLEFLLAKIFKEVLKISDDFIQQIEAKSTGTDQDFKSSNWIKSVIFSSLQFLSIFGHLLDYLMFDSYKYDSIIEAFGSQKSIFKLILSLMLESSKIQTLQKQLIELFSQKRNKRGIEDDSRIILNYAKIMFNLIINPNNIFKQQFVEEQGVYILKKILKKSFAEQEFEIYFYCLGIIPPIIYTYPSQQNDFIDNQYISLLSEQLIDFYNDGKLLHLVSPLFLAIRALISKSDQIREEFIKDQSNLEVVLEVALQAYGSSKLKNIYVSSIILLCECGLQVFEAEAIPNKIQELNEYYGVDSQEPGAQIKLKELLNRMTEKLDKFKLFQRDFIVHNEAQRSLRNNIFDDDQLEKALGNLNKIWNKSLITRSFFITQYGNIDQIIQCLRNLDESVMLNSGKCLITILSKEEGAQDIFLRHKGIQILKNCLQDYNIDIKKVSLSILCNLVKNRDDAKLEILENGVIDLCLNNVDKYPEDDIDHEILCSSLSLISQAVPRQPKIQQTIISQNGLNKIVVQLKIAMDQLSRKPDLNTQIQLSIFDSLCQAVVNIIQGNKNAQDILRTDVQVFNPVVNFLNKAVENLNKNAVYNEQTICNLLNILINAIDTNKQTQEYLLKTFKTYDLIKALITQTQSLKVCGLTSLLLSHLVWTNVDGQALFSTREILKRVIFLMDFNQLINEGEAEQSVDSLMEVSFYSLLCVINLTHENLICQQLVNKLGGISVILRQLKSPSFDPKKTACFCLGNLIQKNEENINELLKIGGVSVLVNLINDEEDDDLSNKSYQCLEYMGSCAVVELVKQTQQILEKREVMWKHGNSIMIDVFLNRERHIYLKALNEQESLPSLREFGPQDQEDIIDNKAMEKLEKILPVINGLIYLKNGNQIESLILYLENREALLKNPSLLKTMLEIFKYQLPIEIHENAMYSILNIILEAPKQLKEQMINQNQLSQLQIFLEDLHHLEFQILRQSQRFLIVDYGIKINYAQEEAMMKEEKTIEEMQPTVMEARVFEYDNTKDQMFFMEGYGNNQEVQRRLVEGIAFEGQGLKKSEVIKHLEDLRALGYSIINNVVLGNSKSAFNLVKLLFKSLPKLLIKDVMILPQVMEQAKSNQNSSSLIYSENLWDESLELLLNLISIKQVYELFKEQSGIDIDFIENLKRIVEDNSLDTQSQSQQQKQKTIIGKLTNIISELKQVN